MNGFPPGAAVHLAAGGVQEVQNRTGGHTTFAAYDICGLIKMFRNTDHAGNPDQIFDVYPRAEDRFKNTLLTDADFALLLSI